jgi:hypothetical protein
MIRVEHGSLQRAICEIEDHLQQQSIAARRARTCSCCWERYLDLRQGYPDGLLDADITDQDHQTLLSTGPTRFRHTLRASLSRTTYKRPDSSQTHKASKFTRTRFLPGLSHAIHLGVLAIHGLTTAPDPILACCNATCKSEICVVNRQTWITHTV